MAYLTFEEYEALGGTANQEQFTKLLPRASSMLDLITQRFYKYHELETDVKMRKEAFKQSLTEQVNYFVETGETTTEGLNSSPQTQTIGDVSVSQTSRFSASGKNESKSIICEESHMFLEGTGLLYRGVSGWR